jgi:hypothetical protein
MKATVCVVCGVLAAATVPALADPVSCADGTTSHAGSGACSEHGGVADGRAKARAERKRAPKQSHARTMSMRMRSRGGVLCNDGTRGPAGSNCAHHDGVAGPITIERLDAGATQTSRAANTDFGPGVRCADGSRSAIAGKDACSDHGGVIGARAAEPRVEGSAAARRTQSRRTRTTHPSGSVLCNDGTMSAGRDACV